MASIDGDAMCYTMAIMKKGIYLDIQKWFFGEKRINSGGKNHLIIVCVSRDHFENKKFLFV